MLKSTYRNFFLFFLLIGAGCTKTVENSFYYLDAVQRVVRPESFSSSPFAFMPSGRVYQRGNNSLASTLIVTPVSSLEQDQHFDAAVGLFRTQTTSGVSDPNQISTGRMAFQSNNIPVQIGSATLNHDSLAWSSDWYYSKTDPNLFDPQDSMAFSYADFNGETYEARVLVTPAFGTITFPDTVPISEGCTIAYQHSIPNDSVVIYVDMFDTSIAVVKPDTGSIVFAPNELNGLHSSFSEVAIYLYRWNWSTLTSAGGKKIAVYSSMETDGQYIPTKR